MFEWRGGGVSGICAWRQRCRRRGAAGENWARLDDLRLLVLWRRKDISFANSGHLAYGASRALFLAGVSVCVAAGVARAAAGGRDAAVASGVASCLLLHPFPCPRVFIRFTCLLAARSSLLPYAPFPVSAYLPRAALYASLSWPPIYLKLRRASGLGNTERTV